MAEDDRIHEIMRMLYVFSARPPLKFPSEAEIPQIARRLFEAARGPKSLWTKWSKERDDIAQRAAEVWVPLEDLREALNMLPGDALTATDVEQRIIALRQETGGFGHGPDDTLKEESYKAYREERTKGTEFIAALGWLEEWTWGAEERLRRAREAELRERIEAEKRYAEARLKSGADCPWTVSSGHKDLHSRVNGRLFRLKELEKSRAPLAPRFEVQEVKSLDDRRGTVIGNYRTRADASNAVKEVAYNPEWG